MRQKSIAGCYQNNVAWLYVARQAKQLGRDIVPSQIIAALSVPGVYRVQLTSFTTLEPTVLAAQQWAHCSDIQLTLGTESADDR